MAAAITYLSTTITIGGQTISLKTDHFPDLAEAENWAAALKKKLVDEGLSFKMAPDHVVSVNLGHIFDWIENKLSSTFKWPPIFTEMFGKGESALHDIVVNLWNLSINTKGYLSFNIQVVFADKFYKDLHIPDIVTNIFRIDSMGIGITYDAAQKIEGENVAEEKIQLSRKKKTKQLE